MPRSGWSSSRGMTLQIILAAEGMRHLLRSGKKRHEAIKSIHDLGIRRRRIVGCVHMERFWVGRGGT